MLENIHWLGQDSFRLDGATTVFTDPVNLAPGQPVAAVICVTHKHYDHLSLPDIAALAGPGTVVVGPSPVTALVRDVETATLAAGDTVEFRGVAVTAVPAYNLDKYRSPGQLFHPREDGGLGYVITHEGVRYYMAGDTDAIPEMDDVGCDVALLPVGGTYTMTAEEAAAACARIAPAMAVPMHYGTVAGDLRDAERFRELCTVPVTILPLETS